MDIETQATEAATSGHRPPTEPLHAVAVRELVRRRLGKSDPWDLALVQRDEVWDQVRMRHLLDSLLAGYPIGALLLCRVAEGSFVIERGGGERRVVDADAEAWQLLDGQQRINALFSMFTEEGRYGRFFLNMSVPRQPPGPISRHSNKERALSYIAWYDDSYPGAPKPQPRSFHIDLSLWFNWAEAHPDGLPDLRVDTVTGILGSLDPHFAADLDDRSARVAVDRLERLWRVWTEPSIPVLSTEVETPLDVLEIYTRINLGGVPVAGTDVYLAAVKTFWPDAEPSLDRLAKRETDLVTKISESQQSTTAEVGSPEEAERFRGSQFLDRMDALRLVSRLASRALRQGDLLPLTVDRLAGVRGKQLIKAMTELTAEESRFIERATLFSRVLEAGSKLGYGLRLVSSSLWDEVFTWAVSFDEADEAWYVDHVGLIDAYLLGASLFRYPQVLGGRYRRAALLECAAAGVAGEPFPLERILSVTRGSGAGLRGSRGAFIRSLHEDEDRQWIKDWNAGLLLSIAQGLPYRITKDGQERKVDWDHIFPQGQADRMWAISKGVHRKHHPLRRHVNSTGNLWALDASTNRILQDMPPTKKFPLLKKWQQAGTDDSVTPAPPPVWAREQWAITETEVQEFVDIDELLNDDPVSIDDAMERFHTLVTARASRLLNHALDSVPGVELFAADAPIDPSDRSPEPLDGLARSLGISTPPPPPRPGPHTPATLPHPWSDRDGEVEWAIKDATKRHTKLTNPNARALPSGSGDGFEFRRWVPVNAPVPYILVGIASRFAGSGGPVWLQIPNTTDGFDSVGALIDESPFIGNVRNDDGHIWLALPMTPELEWTPLADELFERILEIREVIESRPEAGS